MLQALGINPTRFVPPLVAVGVGALVGLLASAALVRGFVGATLVGAMVWRIRLVEGTAEPKTQPGPGVVALAGVAAGLAVLIRIFGAVGGVAAALILLVVLLIAGGEIF